MLLYNAVLCEQLSSFNAIERTFKLIFDFFQEMYESAQKTRSGRTSGGDEVSSWKFGHFIVTFSIFYTFKTT